MVYKGPWQQYLELKSYTHNPDDDVLAALMRRLLAAATMFHLEDGLLIMETGAELEPWEQAVVERARTVTEADERLRRHRMVQAYYPDVHLLEREP